MQNNLAIRHIMPTYESSAVSESMISKDIHAVDDKKRKNSHEISLSNIGSNDKDDDDIEDPVVMSEISIDNPIRELRDRL